MKQRKASVAIVSKATAETASTEAALDKVRPGKFVRLEMPRAQRGRSMKKQRPKSARKKVPSRVEPTPHELATLAVAVSQDTTLDNIKYVLSHGGDNIQWAESSEETSVKKALALWLTAREVLEKWRANPADVFPQPTPHPSPKPEPKRYPVTLGEFLRLMVPPLTGRTGEQYGLFREYLAFRLRNPTPPAMTWDHEHSVLYAKTWPAFDCCNPRIVPAFGDDYSYSAEKSKPAKPAEPTKDDEARYFALWQAKPIPDPNSFWYHAKWFRDWYEKYRAGHISAARRAAGAKGLVSPKRTERHKVKDGPTTSGRPDKRRGARPPRERFQKVIAEAAGESVKNVRDILNKDSSNP